jgi:outer membrane protein OmpA-like peptidoglycan-associated protein
MPPKPQRPSLPLLAFVLACLVGCAERQDATTDSADGDSATRPDVDLPARTDGDLPARADGDSAAPTDGDSQARADGDSAASASEPAAIVTGQACEEAANAAAEITEQSAAAIPLVVGLTFAYNWVGPESGPDDFDHECLAQVTDVDAARVVFMSRCDDPTDTSRAQRRTQVCRSDLRDGSIYRTQFGASIPDLVAKSTMNVLSRRAFRELRDRGQTHFRQVHLMASMWQTDAPAPEPDATVYVQEDVAGALRRVGEGKLPVLLNDTLVDMPVIRAEATLRDPQRRVPEQQMQFAIVDDERFPVVLDNLRVTTAATIKFLRITWPEQSAIERDLTEKRESTVYGIYFDYNSAELRPESEVTLQEIARALEAHPDWTLAIDGHTDSIGGATFNRELSVRRAEAVRTALVDRYGIAAPRLTAAGSGDSRPVDTNDTPEGRTRNRRVELRRP